MPRCGESLHAQVVHPAFQPVQRLDAEVGVKLTPENERRRGDDARWADDAWTAPHDLAIVVERGGQRSRTGDRVHIALDIGVGEPGALAVRCPERPPDERVVVARERLFGNTLQLEEANVGAAQPLAWRV